MATLGERARSSLRSPLAWVLAGVFVLHIVGIGWGLPASDGWDNDGVAPRDFLSGLVETFTPGHYFTYPPVHLALLGILTLPVTLVALARAPSLEPSAVIHEFVRVPYMTTFAAVARIVSVAMSVAIVYAMGKIAEELGTRRTGLSVAAVAGVNIVLTYYGHTTNLDVPYLFWGSFSLLALTRAIARHEPRRLRSCAVLAGLAVGTKDQAYALFLLGTPLALGVWVVLDAWPRQNARALGKEVATAVAFAVGIFLVADGVVVNPTGFRARLSFLAGSASQDYAYYSNDALGRLLVLTDAVGDFGRYYPAWFFAPLVVFGFAMGVVRLRRDAPRLAPFLVPLFATVSFTLLFNCVARRTEHRFLLPQMVLVSVYGGVGLEVLLFAIRQRWARLVAQAVTAVAFATALFDCADVDANFLFDPRYDAEAWLRAQVAAGDRLEVHGENVYLPRLPEQASVVRVGSEPIAGRSPLPGVAEEQDALLDVRARAPRWIVVSEGYAGPFLLEHVANVPSGRVFSRSQIVDATHTDAKSFFRGLLDGREGYGLVHVSTWSSKIWPRADIHASLSRDIWIFERRDGAVAPAG